MWRGLLQNRCHLDFPQSRECGEEICGCCRQAQYIVSIPSAASQNQTKGVVRVSVVRLGSVRTRYVARSQWLKVKISSLVDARIYVEVEVEVEVNVDLIGEVDPLSCLGQPFHHRNVGEYRVYPARQTFQTNLLIA